VVADPQLAWVLSHRDRELDAWRALYDALHPAPAGYAGSVLDRRAA
jgi:hypothetical protein